jgi:ppGpp synthetase/RelA/SpoT-type nucleotidyltranferase
MSVEVPSGLVWLVDALAGQAWPDGNEDGLAALGGAWADVGGVVAGLGGQLDDVVGQVMDGISGDVADQFAAYVGGLRSNLAAVADGAGQVGALAAQSGVQLEEAKYMILLQVAWVAVELAMWAYSLFGAAVVPTVYAAGRFVIQAIVRRLVMAAAEGAAFMAVANMLVQGLEWLRHHTGWDWGSVVSALESGALAGAIGGVVHVGAGAVAPALADSVVGRVVVSGAAGVVGGEVMNLAMGGDQNAGLAFLAGMMGGLAAGRHGGGEAGEGSETVREPALEDLGSLVGWASDLAPNRGGEEGDLDRDLFDGGRIGPGAVAGGSGAGSAGGADDVLPAGGPRPVAPEDRAAAWQGAQDSLVEGYGDRLGYESALSAAQDRAVAAVGQAADRAELIGAVGGQVSVAGEQAVREQVRAQVQEVYAQAYGARGQQWATGGPDAEVVAGRVEAVMRSVPELLERQAAWDQAVPQVREQFDAAYDTAPVVVTRRALLGEAGVAGDEPARAAVWTQVESAARAAYEQTGATGAQWHEQVAQLLDEVPARAQQQITAGADGFGQIRLESSAPAGGGARSSVDGGSGDPVDARPGYRYTIAGGTPTPGADRLGARTGTAGVDSGVPPEARVAVAHQALQVFDEVAAARTAHRAELGLGPELSQDALRAAGGRFAAEAVGEFARRAGDLDPDDPPDWAQWQGRFDAMVHTGAGAHLDYEGGFQRALAQARTGFQDAVEEWGQNLAEGVVLAPDAIDRVRQQYEAHLQEAYAKVYQAPPGTWDAHGGPDAVWNSAARRLQAGIPGRMTLEDGALRALREGAGDFHDLSRPHVLPDTRRGELAAEFRTETAEQYYDIWAPGHLDLTDWLADEQRHGDSYGSTLTELDTRHAGAEPVPGRSGSADPDRPGGPDSGATPTRPGTGTGQARPDSRPADADRDQSATEPDDHGIVTVSRVDQVTGANPDRFGPLASGPGHPVTGLADADTRLTTTGPHQAASTAFDPAAAPSDHAPSTGPAGTDRTGVLTSLPGPETVSLTPDQHTDTRANRSAPDAAALIAVHEQRSGIDPTSLATGSSDQARTGAPGGQASLDALARYAAEGFSYDGPDLRALDAVSWKLTGLGPGADAFVAVLTRPSDLGPDLSDLDPDLGGQVQTLLHATFDGQAVRWADQHGHLLDPGRSLPGPPSRVESIVFDPQGRARRFAPERWAPVPLGELRTGFGGVRESDPAAVAALRNALPRDEETGELAWHPAPLDRQGTAASWLGHLTTHAARTQDTAAPRNAAAREITAQDATAHETTAQDITANCVEAALAFAQTYTHGVPTVAAEVLPGITGQSLDKIQHYVGAAALPAPGGLEQIARELARAPQHSLAFITLGYPDHTSHVIIAVRQPDGTLAWVDPHQGTAAAHPDQLGLPSHQHARYQLTDPYGHPILPPPQAIPLNHHIPALPALHPGSLAVPALVYDHDTSSLRPSSLGAPSTNHPVSTVGPYKSGSDESLAATGPINDDQRATLDRLRYGFDPEVTFDLSHDSFYSALLGLAAMELRDDREQTPTPGEMRGAVADAVEADLARTNSHYANLIAVDQDQAQLLRNLRDPRHWDRQASVLVPHVAADVYGLDLGVIGWLGRADAVGDLTYVRRSGPGGVPFLVVNVEDHFYPVFPRDLTEQEQVTADRTLRARWDPNRGSPWTASLSGEEQLQVEQARAQAPLSDRLRAQVADAWLITTLERIDWPVPGAGGRQEDFGAQYRARAATVLEHWEQPEAEDALRELEEAERDADVLSGARIEEQVETLSARYTAAAAQTRLSGPAVRRAAEILAVHEMLPDLAHAAADQDPDRPPGAVAAELARIHAEAERAEQAQLREDPQAPAEARRQAHDEAVRRESEGDRFTGLMTRLADAATRVERARNDYSAVQEAVDRGAAAAAEVERPARQDAAHVAEWQLRHNNALDALVGPEPQRATPPGFGVPRPLGGHDVAMGRAGRFIRLGDTEFTDFEGLADKVVAALPPDSPWAAQTRQAVSGFLADHGGQAFARRVIEEGIDFPVEAGDVYDVVSVQLDLGHTDFIQHAIALSAELVPIGQSLGRRQHYAVEADHESTSGTSITTGNSRSLGFTHTAAVNVGPLRRFGLQAGYFGASGTSSDGHTASTAAVSATKRLFPLSGNTSYFDVRGAALITYTRVLTEPDRQVTEPRRAPQGRTPLNLRVSFPTELTMSKDSDATRPQMGVNARLLDHEEDEEGPLHRAAARVAEVPHSFMAMAESAHGLADLRARVRLLVEPWRDKGLLEAVADYLAEDSFLRMSGDIMGPGSTSPRYIGDSPEHAIHLVVQAKLLNAAVLSVDPVPLKEESQRFVNIADGRSHGSTLGLNSPNFRAGATIGDLNAQLGGNHSVAGEADGSVSLAGNRAMNSNSGSGHISGLVYLGDSVRYRAAMRMTVDVVKPGSGPDSTTGVSGDITVYLRVPAHQRDRFEASLRRAAADSALEIPDDQDTIAVDPGLTGPQLEDELAERDLPRYPPVSLAVGRGTGFTAISHLAGAEKVLPELVRLIQQAGRPMAWSRDWDAMELAGARRELASRFTAEGLKNWSGSLFQPGGLKTRLTRPAVNGVEVVTVTVTGRLRSAAADAAAQTVPRPVRSGRVASAKLEIMPSAFAGHGGDDTVTSGFNADVQFGFTIGLGTETPARTTPWNGKYNLNGMDNYTTSVGASAFALQAILYTGPLRTFDYDVTLAMHVEVEHLSDTLTSDVPRIAALVRLGPVGLGRLRNTSAATVDGSARFVIVEKLAPTQEPTVEQIRETGQVRQAADRAAEPAHTYPPAAHVTTAVSRDLAGVLGDGHVPLTPGDQVMEVLGSEHVADTIVSRLAQFGLTPEAYGTLPWVMTRAETLASSMVRGPSVISHEVVRRGTLADRRATITLEGFPFNDRTTSAIVDMYRMDVAEGNGQIGSAHSTSRNHTLNVSGGLGVLVHRFLDTSRITQSVQPLNYTFNFADKNVAKSQGLVSTAGRLIQSRDEYLEHTADLAWRVTVTVRDTNMFGVIRTQTQQDVVEIVDGVTFLRTAHEPERPVLPAGVPGTLRVDTMKAISDPGSREVVPVWPILPVAAASERIRPLPPPAGAAGPVGRLEVTGDGNPVLDAVQELLGAHAKEHLEGGWAVLGADSAGRLPAKLNNLLNVGSLEAFMDLLLGPGLVLHSIGTGGSVPFAHDRVQIVITATRDPEGTGYAARKYTAKGNIARYWFHLNAASDAHAEDAQRSNAITTTPEFDPAHSGRLTKVNAAVSTTASRSTGEADVLTRTDAIRDTFFMGGASVGYAGELKIEISLNRTYVPSRPANTLVLGLPDLIARTVQGTGNHETARRSTTVMMEEWVQVPLQLLPADEPTQVPEGLVAVREVPPGTSADTLGTVLGIRPEHLSGHTAISIGFDHAKLRILQREVVRRLANNVTPMSGQSSWTARRLLDAGARALDSMYYAISHPTFTRQLYRMLGSEGLTLPPLVREGGPVADTTGEVTIRVELVKPQVLRPVDAWNESVSYKFRESLHSTNQSTGRQFQIAPAAGENSDNHLHPTLAQNVTANAANSQTHSGFGVLKTMTEYLAQNMKVDFSRVRSGALVTLTLKTANARGPVSVAGGEVTVSFLVENAAEFALSPELALELGLLHPRGLPIKSGLFFAAHGALAEHGVADDDVDALRAAAAMPRAPGAFALHVRLAADGRFVVGDRALTAAQFHDLALADRTDLNDSTLILVAGGGDRATGSAPSPAEELAAVRPARPAGSGDLGQADGEPAVSVIAAQGDVHITADGSTQAVELDMSGGRASTRAWHDGRWTKVTLSGQPPRVEREHQGRDLREALAAFGLHPGPRPEHVSPPTAIVSRVRPAGPPALSSSVSDLDPGPSRARSTRSAGSSAQDRLNVLVESPQSSKPSLASRPASTDLAPRSPEERQEEPEPVRRPGPSGDDTLDYTDLLQLGVPLTGQQQVMVDLQATGVPARDWGLTEGQRLALAREPSVRSAQSRSLTPELEHRQPTPGQDRASTPQQPADTAVDKGKQRASGASAAQRQESVSWVVPVNAAQQLLADRLIDARTALRRAHEQQLFMTDAMAAGAGPSQGDPRADAQRRVDDAFDLEDAVRAQLRESAPRPAELPEPFRAGESQVRPSAPTPTQRADSAALDSDLVLDSGPVLDSDLVPDSGPVSVSDLVPDSAPILDSEPVLDDSATRLRAQQNLEVQAAVEKELAPIDPRVAGVVVRLVYDDKPSSLADALRDPETRGLTLAVLQEISRSRQFDHQTFTEFLRDHPGRGALFEPVTHAENHTEAGTPRLIEFVDRTVRPGSPRDIGADTALLIHDYLDKTDRGLPPPGFSRQDSARLAALREYARTVDEQVRPAVVRELRSILDTLPPGADARITVRAKDAMGLVDKVRRMSKGWKGRAPRPDYRVGGVPDVVGARITVRATAELAQVFELVKQRFGVGDGGRILEIQNMYAQPKPNNLAYRLVALIVSVNVDQVPYTFELQLVTRRAVVAAELEHSSVYKNHVAATPWEQAAVKRAMQEAAALEQLEAEAAAFMPATPAARLVTGPGPVEPALRRWQARNPVRNTTDPVGDGLVRTWLEHHATDPAPVQGDLDPDAEQAGPLSPEAVGVLGELALDYVYGPVVSQDEQPFESDDDWLALDDLAPGRLADSKGVWIVAVDAAGRILVRGVDEDGMSLATVPGGARFEGRIRRGPLAGAWLLTRDDTEQVRADALARQSDGVAVDLSERLGVVVAAQRPWDVDPDVDLDESYGALVNPYVLRVEEQEAGGELRLNPLYYDLDAFPTELLERRDAVWLWAVRENGEIVLGTEQTSLLAYGSELEQLREGIEPFDTAGASVADLDAALRGRGHPTIAAGFDDLGYTRPAPGRVSGELRYNFARERWEIRDESGRYMRFRIGNAAEYRRRWLGNVADRMSARFDEQVRAVLFDPDRVPTLGGRRDLARELVSRLREHLLRRPDARAALGPEPRGRLAVERFIRYFARRLNQALAEGAQITVGKLGADVVNLRDLELLGAPLPQHQDDGRWEASLADWNLREDQGLRLALISREVTDRAHLAKFARLLSGVLAAVAPVNPSVNEIKRHPRGSELINLLMDSGAERIREALWDDAQTFTVLVDRDNRAVLDAVLDHPGLGRVLLTHPDRIALVQRLAEPPAQPLLAALTQSPHGAAVLLDRDHRAVLDALLDRPEPAVALLRNPELIPALARTLALGPDGQAATLPAAAPAAPAAPAESAESADSGGVDEAAVAQAGWKYGLLVLSVARDNDSFINALITGAQLRDGGGRALTAPQVRERLASALEDDLRRPEAERSLWPSLDSGVRENTLMDRAVAAGVAAEDRFQWVSRQEPAADWFTDRERAEAAALLRDRDRHGYVTGYLAPPVASRVFGISLSVVQLYDRAPRVPYRYTISGEQVRDDAVGLVRVSSLEGPSTEYWMSTRRPHEQDLLRTWGQPAPSAQEMRLLQILRQRLDEGYTAARAAGLLWTSRVAPDMVSRVPVHEILGLLHADAFRPGAQPLPEHVDVARLRARLEQAVWARLRAGAPAAWVRAEFSEVVRSGSAQEGVGSFVTPGEDGRAVVRLEARRGLVGYDLRRVRVAGPDGSVQVVRDHTVRIRVVPGPGVGSDQAAEVEQAYRDGVEQVLNRESRMPGGDVFHYTVEFEHEGPADGGPVHLVVTVVGAGEGVTQNRWPVGLTPWQAAHEALHGLGVGHSDIRPGDLMTGSGALGAGSVVLAEHLARIEEVAAAQVVLPDPYPGAGVGGVVRPTADERAAWHDAGDDAGVETLGAPGRGETGVGDQVRDQDEDEEFDPLFDGEEVDAGGGFSVHELALPGGGAVSGVVQGGGPTGAASGAGGREVIDLTLPDLPEGVFGGSEYEVQFRWEADHSISDLLSAAQEEELHGYLAGRPGMTLEQVWEHIRDGYGKHMTRSGLLRLNNKRHDIVRSGQTARTLPSEAHGATLRAALQSLAELSERIRQEPESAWRERLWRGVGEVVGREASALLDGVVGGSGELSGRDRRLALERLGRLVGGEAAGVQVLADYARYVVAPQQEGKLPAWVAATAEWYLGRPARSIPHVEQLIVVTAGGIHTSVKFGRWVARQRNSGHFGGLTEQGQRVLALMGLVPRRGAGSGAGRGVGTRPVRQTARRARLDRGVVGGVTGDQVVVPASGSGVVEVADRAAGGSGSSGGPWAPDEAQAGVLGALGLEAVPAAASGDCLLEALVASDTEGVFEGRGFAEIRARLAIELQAELHANPGGGELWGLVDEQAMHAWVIDRASADRIEGLSVTELADHHIGLLNAGGGWGDRQRRDVARRLRTPDNWNDVSGDIAPIVAGFVYDVTVEVLVPGANRFHTTYQAVGPDRPVLRLVYRDGHWLGTRPAAATAAHPAQTTHNPLENSRSALVRGGRWEFAGLSERIRAEFEEDGDAGSRPGADEAVRRQAFEVLEQVVRGSQEMSGGYREQILAELGNLVGEHALVDVVADFARYWLAPQQDWVYRGPLAGVAEWFRAHPGDLNPTASEQVDVTAGGITTAVHIGQWLQNQRGNRQGGGLTVPGRRMVALMGMSLGHAGGGSGASGAWRVSDAVQAVVLESAGLAAVATAASGDCLLEALVVSAPEGTFGGEEFAQIRGRLAHALLEELEEHPGGRGPLWKRVDVAAEQAWGIDQAMAAPVEGWSVEERANHHLAVLRAGGGWGDQQRREVAERLRTPGNWDDVSGDIAPVVAGLVFGLTVRVLGPGASGFYALTGEEEDEAGEVGGDRPVVSLVHLGDHWLGTRPATASAAHPARTTHDTPAKSRDTVVKTTRQSLAELSEWIRAESEEEREMRMWPGVGPAVRERAFEVIGGPPGTSQDLSAREEQRQVLKELEDLLKERGAVVNVLADYARYVAARRQVDSYPAYLAGVAGWFRAQPGELNPGSRRQIGVTAGGITTRVKVGVWLQNQRNTRRGAGLTVPGRRAVALMGIDLRRDDGPGEGSGPVRQAARRELLGREVADGGAGDLAVGAAMEFADGFAQLVPEAVDAGPGTGADFATASGSGPETGGFVPSVGPGSSWAMGSGPVAPQEWDGTEWGGTRWDGMASAVGGVSEPSVGSGVPWRVDGVQAGVLGAWGLQVVPGGGSWDELVEALVASDVQGVFGEGEAGVSRGRLADELAWELDVHPGGGRLWRRVGGQAVQAWAVGQAVAGLLPGHDWQQTVGYYQLVAGSRGPDGGPVWGDWHRRQVIERLRVPDRSFDARGDLAAAVAGAVHDVTVRVLEPGAVGFRTVYQAEAWHPVVHLVYRDGHWLGTRRTW